MYGCAMVKVASFGSKNEVLEALVRDRTVLHLGAVGETCGDTETRIVAARTSLHAHLTRVSRECVGVDYDAPSVRALTERGIFDNLVCGDVTKIQRSDVPMTSIDFIVAGDTIEHLSNPGMMLENMRNLADLHTQLIVTTPNALGLPIFVRHTFGRAIEGEDHVCSFNAQTLTNLLKRHGWYPRELRTCHQERATSSAWFRLGSMIFQRLPQWGGTLMCVADR